MKWSLAIVALGVLIGPEVSGEVNPSPSGAAVRTLAEATLAVVLVADASRIRLDALRREYVVPLRLLGIGLPLTIALGAGLGVLLCSQLTIAETLVLAVLLAPTDAALGQAVVTDPRLPSRIRQGLNVESGLNDGICLPVLFIVLAAAEVESHVANGHRAITIVAEEIGYGILGGAGAGLLVALVVTVGRSKDLIADSWLQVIPVAGAALAYGVASALGGSGFIAAFLAGMLFGALSREPGEASRFNEASGSLLDGLTFLAFGAVLLGPALAHLSWSIVAYAVLSLTVVRMVPVAIALLGTGARRQTAAFLGWFGPRGLASIVFAAIIVEQSQLPHVQTILLTTYVTVGLSVLAHGLSAAPLADRYAHWYRSHPRDRLPTMESIPAEAHRPRGPVPHPPAAPEADDRLSGAVRGESSPGSGESHRLPTPYGQPHVGQVFAFSVTAALNPTLLAATTVMLTLLKPERLLLGYLIGAMVTSITCGLLLVFVLPHSSTSSTSKHTVNPILNIGLGALVLVIVFVVATGRDTRGRARSERKREAAKNKPPPRWKRQLSKGSARDTFVVGALLSFPGASYIAGMELLHKQNLDTGLTILSVVAFNLIMLMLLELPLIGYATRPQWTEAAVTRFSDGLSAHGGRIALIAGTALGTILILRGIVNW